jgi:hypothetical protein
MIRFCFSLCRTEEGRYVPTLMFDDEEFCWQVCELLKRHYGWLIKMIGELDVP